MTVFVRNLLRYLAFAMLLTSGAASVFAQSTGIVRGTVTDPSGAAVPNASVTVTETSTGVKRDTASNESGIFVFPNLPIGTYSLRVSASGFETQDRPGLQLITGQTMDLPVQLAIGTQTTQVIVSSETQEIETTTSNMAESIGREQMSDLPLNGRNPLELTALTAGAVLTSVGTESGQVDNTGLSVNGLRATQNTYTLDGTIYVDRFFDSVPRMPNPDALQEFTIQSSNYSAEHAGAGALVQLSTRSGTDKLHGQAWEYFRNTVLDGRDYFQTTVPPYKLNQFGGTVGGPVFKSKTAFFFFSAEDLQQRSSPNPINIQLPTAAELNGDFSALLSTGTVLYNPSTGCPYGQTRTAASCSGTITNIITTPMNPLSKNVNQQYLAQVEALSTPVPNGTYNVFSSSSNANVDSTQYLVRLDKSMGDKDHLTGRYFYNEHNFQRPFNAPLGFFANNLFRNQSLTISDAHVFSNTLTGAVYASFLRAARTQIPEAPGLKTLQDLGAKTPFGSPNEDLVPFPGVRANLSGYVNIFSGGALTQDTTTFELKTTFVKVLNRHTLTMGGSLERDRIDMDDYSTTPGGNTFNGQRTQAPPSTKLPTGFSKSGNVLADFYLGLENDFVQDNGRKAYLRELRPALFIQDDWKVTPRLTFNLGVRWDPWLPPIDRNGTLVGFNLSNPNYQSTVAPNAPKGMMFIGDPGAADSMFRNNFKDFGPRVGFAYNIFGNSRTVVRGAYGIFYGFPEGLLYQRTDNQQPIDLSVDIANPPSWDNIYADYPGGSPYPRGHVDRSQFKSYKFTLPVAGGMLNPNSKVEYTQEYNFALEQSLGGGFALTTGWVGNHAEHVMASRQFNPAVYTGPGNTVKNEDSRRLFPNLGAVELADAYEYEITNAGEVTVRHRSRHGLTLLTSLVWMKTIDNSSGAVEGQTGPSNPFNFNSGRGVAEFDQALRFRASVNYVLPHFHVNGFASGISNGWHINAILQDQSGLPISIKSGVDNSLSGIGNDFADFVPGVSVKRPAGVSPILAWFNPAAFQKNATGTFGNTPRNFLRGPSYNNVDMSLFKDILPERRVHGQLQAEAFNALNHTNFGLPVSTVSSGTFGRITSTAGAPRIWQFVAKVIF